MSAPRTSWARLAWALVQGRLWRLRRRQRRLYWFKRMKFYADTSLENKGNAGIYATCFNAYVAVSVQYHQYGGFDQGRVTKRLMVDGGSDGV